jgi:hypothetical protein
MRATLPETLTRGRIAGDPAWGAYGCFQVLGPAGLPLRIIASAGDDDDPEANGWEHVSVSTKHRIPTWAEMCFVKDLFWDEEETVIQFHPPKSQYVNQHPYVLHLWRQRHTPFPLPPSHLVGTKDANNPTEKERAAEAAWRALANAATARPATAPAIAARDRSR